MDISHDNLSFIFGRRSIRVYSPGSIPEPTVTKLLEAAMAAPSAMTKDPWRFVVVRQSSTLSALGETLPGGKMLKMATLAIVVCGDLEAAFDRQVSFMLQDCSAAIENLLLASHALGVGGCWVGVHPNENAIHTLQKLFRLPSSIIPISVVSLGLPGEEPGPRTRYNRDYIHAETW